MSDVEPADLDTANESVGVRGARFVRSSAALIVLRVTGFGAAFLFSVVLAGSAGADGAGRYYLAVAVATIGYTASKLGTDGAILRLIGAGDVRESSSEQAAVYRSAWLLVGASSTIVGLALVVGAPVIARVAYDDPGITTPLRIVALGVPAMALTSVTGRSLLAVGRPFVGSAVEGGALSIIQLVLYLAGLRTFGASGAAISLAAANVALLGIGIWRWRTVGAHAAEAVADIRGLLSESLQFLWTDVLSVVAGFVGTIALGALATSADAGIYAVGSRVAKVGALALIPLTSLIAPQFARADQAGDRIELRRHLRHSSWSLLGLASIATAAVVLGAPLAARVLGRDFDDSVATMRLLAIGFGLNIGTGASVAMLQMTGRARGVARSMLVATVVQVVLSVVLIPPYGPEGAALASLGAIVLKSAICTWVAIAASAHHDEKGAVAP